MVGQNLVQRLAHSHYIANGLLSLPLPLLLSLATDAGLQVRCLSFAGPMLLVALVLLKNGSREAETNTELVTWNMRIFNLFGLLFTRNWLGLGWIHVGTYLLAWLVVSFVFPQPPYLGPSKMIHFHTLSFDEDVLIIPPVTKFSSETTNATTSEAKITEISSDSTVDDYDKRRKTSDVWYVVLFHVEWSRKSRELEMTLARMSNRLASSTLSFGVVTPESTPQIFYDLDLSTSVTSSFQDLPLIALYYRGELVDRLPKDAPKIALERKERRDEMRRQGWSSKRLREGQRKREGKKRTEEADAGDGDEGSESGSGTDESEDEREVQIVAARQRYEWDRTQVRDATLRVLAAVDEELTTSIGRGTCQGSIETAFGLNAKSKAGSQV